MGTAKSISTGLRILHHYPDPVTELPPLPPAQVDANFLESLPDEHYWCLIGHKLGVCSKATGRPVNEAGSAPAPTSAPKTEVEQLEAEAVAEENRLYHLMRKAERSAAIKEATEDIQVAEERAKLKAGTMKPKRTRGRKQVSE